MATGYQRTTVPVTILTGQSLSGTADIGTHRLIGIEMPAAWDAASLTFSVSEDGVTFRDLYSTTVEVAVASAGASRYLALETTGAGVASTGMAESFPRFVKVRSGTSGAAVNQTADRIVKLVLATEG